MFFACSFFKPGSWFWCLFIAEPCGQVQNQKRSVPIKRVICRRYSFDCSFVRMKLALSACLTTSHHLWVLFASLSSGWATTTVKLLGPNGKYALRVIFKNTTAHCQFGNRTGSQQPFNCWYDALLWRTYSMISALPCNFAPFLAQLSCKQGPQPKPGQIS